LVVLPKNADDFLGVGRPNSLNKAATTLEYALPGGEKNVETPGQYVNSLFTFGLTAAGILAVGVIVWGGFVYMTAAGNQGRISEAKDYIAGALLGLVLLLASFLILKTIDPQLVNLEINIPEIEKSGSGGW